MFDRMFAIFKSKPDPPDTITITDFVFKNQSNDEYYQISQEPNDTTSSLKNPKTKKKNKDFSTLYLNNMRTKTRFYADPSFYRTYRFPKTGFEIIDSNLLLFCSI